MTKKFIQFGNIIIGNRKQKMNFTHIIKSMEKLNVEHQRIEKKFSTASKKNYVYKDFLKEDEADDLRVFGNNKLMQDIPTMTLSKNSDKKILRALMSDLNLKKVSGQCRSVRAAVRGINRNHFMCPEVLGLNL